jgi:hypothetical protein
MRTASCTQSTPRTSSRRCTLQSPGPAAHRGIVLTNLVELGGVLQARVPRGLRGQLLLELELGALRLEERRLAEAPQRRARVHGEAHVHGGALREPRRAGEGLPRLSDEHLERAAPVARLLQEPVLEVLVCSM